jgi:hypothetical protein
LDSVSVRVGELVKDGAKRRRLRRSAILDKLANTNNWQPSDQGRPAITVKLPGVSAAFTCAWEADSFAPRLRTAAEGTKWSKYR